MFNTGSNSSRVRRLLAVALTALAVFLAPDVGPWSTEVSFTVKVGGV